MAEINSTGFVGKTQNEYFTEEIELYQVIDSEWNLDPSTPDGLKAAHDAEIFSLLDEQLQKAYNSKDPNKSTGVELDTLSALTGTMRIEGSQSQTTVTLTGTAGTPVPAGSRIKTNGQTVTTWSLDSDVTLPGTTTATCLTLGPTQLTIGELSVIVDTVGGWQGVTNTTVATLGTNAESDASLRLRRKQLVALSGNNQVDSMIAQIYTVDGVTRVKIYENDTRVIDTNNQPGNSLAVIVEGGIDADVAMAIYLKKNPGVALVSLGNNATVILVTSPKYPSNTKNITFSRPIYVDMNIVINIKSDGALPGNVGDEIKQAIIDYVQGSLDDGSGFNNNGFDIGDDVPIGRMYTPVNFVIGKYGNSYITSLTVNGQTSIVPISIIQLARFATANITVNVT